MKKGNRCRVGFYCSFSLKHQCVFFAVKKKGCHICKYEGDYGTCTSKVAQVNAMNLKIKELLTEGE